MKCPIRNLVEKRPFGNDLIDESCLKEGCAWWTGRDCAILDIAYTLKGIAQNGIGFDKREE